MKHNLVIRVFLLLIILLSCNIITQKAKNKSGDCIKSFEYFHHTGVGPESLVSIVQIQDKELKNVIIRNPRLFSYQYLGGIYNIDTLFFPKPQIEIYNYKDSSLIFDQSVFELRLYSKEFIDSMMKLTKEEIKIVITDTLSKKIWTVSACKTE
jgi:hypothetical protein